MSNTAQETGRPEGIPEDVWTIAGRVLGSPSFKRETVRARIARALLAQIEDCAKVADEREAICAEAVEMVCAGTLYPDIPTAAATENSARMEASHIAGLIRKKARP